jgi:hypothetical protein
MEPLLRKGDIAVVDTSATGPAGVVDGKVYLVAPARDSSHSLPRFLSWASSPYTVIIYGTSPEIQTPIVRKIDEVFIFGRIVQVQRTLV